MPHLSIIIPTLNEAEGITHLLNSLLPLRQRGHEIIVADGGSQDGTVALARPLADWVIEAPRGRAAQMNAGAMLATGEMLLFLHADTQLPDRADEMILEQLSHGHTDLHQHTTALVWGRFDVRIAGTHPLLNVIAWFMNHRSRWTCIATGDQAIFVCRDGFQAVGGFSDIPLMEDIVLSTKLKASSAPICFKTPVTTSGRRWEQHGVCSTLLKMWRLRLAFFLGADPSRLAKAYGYAPREQ